MKKKANLKSLKKKELSKVEKKKIIGGVSITVINPDLIEF